MSDEEAPQGQSWGVGGGCGDVSGSGGGNGGGSDTIDSSGAMSHEEEIYIPPITRSHTDAGSSGFDATLFYQYINNRFSRTTLRLDAINEWQQQHAQD